jgi:hypothetical protein
MDLGMLHVQVCVLAILQGTNCGMADILGPCFFAE